jgi:tetrahydromethanopterin S-methyltransferase subunit C
MSVSRYDLKEVGEVGVLQEGVGAAGVIFVSVGATEAINILVEHHATLGDYVGWLFGCGSAMLFGVVLIVVGYRVFKMKQKKIEHLLGNDSDALSQNK